MEIKIVVPENTQVSSHAVSVLKIYLEKISHKTIEIISNEARCPQDSNLIIIGSPDRNKKAADFCNP